MLYTDFIFRTQEPHGGLLEAAWVSTIPHIISHVRWCVLKVARISKIEVRLTLLIVLVGVHRSVGINVVALLVVHLVVLHVRLSRRGELHIGLRDWRVVMLMPMIDLALAVKLLVCTDPIEVEVRKAATNFRHNAPTTSCVPHPAIAVATRSERLRYSEMRPHRFHQANSLSVGSHGQSTLDDIVSKRIHH